MSNQTHRIGKNTVPRRTLLAITMTAILLATLALSACVSNNPAAPQKMILATTTSTQDSGLLDYFIPKFDRQYNIKTSVVSVGTGQALALGQSGDADVLLVHSKSSELDFVANGYGMYRKDVMYNWFLMVGPSADPAGIKGSNDSIASLRAIYNSNSTFCSRGDNSGTYTKEVGLWKKVNATDYPTRSWYLNLSQGMGETLITCNEKKAYTLTDSGTWYSMTQNLPNLQILCEGDKANLLNQYGVIPVNGSNGPHVNTKLGIKFADWIVSSQTQEIIARYEKGGHQLFFPNAAG